MEPRAALGMERGMDRLYSALLWLLLPFALLRLYWRSLRSPGYRQRWGERFGHIQRRRGDCLWIHAVSVGEAQAAQPLVKALAERYPELPLVISTTTPTGAETVQRLFRDQAAHVYFPFDLPGILHRYLRRLRPRLLLMMETEIWPNLLRLCAQEGVPTVLANARLSASSARGYQRFGAFAQQTFARIGHVAAQSEADAGRFLALGVEPVRLTVTGSIKFDVNLPASLHEQSEVLRRQWGEDRPVWVAASTHEGEDELVLDAHAYVRDRLPGALLVLVPRHPERFDRVAALCRRRGFDTVRRSEQRPCGADTGVFLGDSMGELPLFYEAADVAFVGGSLVKVGGHNVLEPAASGVPVVFGPHMHNFTAISELLLEEGAAQRVGSSEELAALLQNWLTDASERSRLGENGRRVVAANRGALERLLKVVEAELNKSVPEWTRQ